MWKQLCRDCIPVVGSGGWLNETQHPLKAGEDEVVGDWTTGQWPLVVVRQES